MSTLALAVGLGGALSLVCQRPRIPPPPPMRPLARPAGPGGPVSWVCRRLRIPPLLPLMGIGMLLGHSGLGIIEGSLLGAGLPALVGVVVALLIFEGSLLLDRETLKH